MSACIRCNDTAVFCARHASEQVLKLRAEVADLKARLKAARALLPYTSNFTALSGVAERQAHITDLRVKNWRELERSGPALKARPTSDLTTEGWWYANKRSIDVLGRSPRGDVTCVRIRLSDILRRLRP